jgi:hypothetical protein
MNSIPPPQRTTALGSARAWLSLLAALALVLRLFGPTAPAAAAEARGDVLAELLAGIGICHGDPDAGDTTPPSTSDCMLCPLCAPPAPAMTALPPAPVSRPGVARPMAPFLLPQPQAPPRTAFAAIQPRAPPTHSA